MRKPVQRGDAYSLKDGEIGKEYVGTYTGNKTVETPNGKSILWQFVDEDDRPFAIWGFTNLNFQMENVPVNSLCYVTYLGAKKEKNKFGKYPYLAKVEIEDGTNGTEFNPVKE